MEATFSSPLAPSIEGLIRSKRAQGYKYVASAYLLRKLDEYALETSWESPVLGREIAEGFAGARPGESWETTSGRRGVARALGE